MGVQLTHRTPDPLPYVLCIPSAPGRIASAGHPESPFIQFRLAISISAIPSSALTTPNPGNPWDGVWSVDEGSAAVRVESGDMGQVLCWN